MPTFAARANQGSTDAAKDVLPVTASATLNIFGETFNAVNGPAKAARACKALLADAAVTVTIVTATGQTRTAVVLPAGWSPLQVIQVTSLSGGNLWAAI